MLNLNYLLKTESRRTVDISGCKTPDELLKQFQTARDGKEKNMLPDEYLEMLSAAGSQPGPTVTKAMTQSVPESTANR